MNDARVIFGTALLLLVVGFPAGCSSARDAAYKQSVEQWRKNHLAKVTSDDGDLTYAALQWLREGTNSFGSAPGNDVVLPSPVPPKAGSIDLKSGKFTVHVNPDAPITMGGKPIRSAELKPDDWDSRMVLGDLTFYIHQAGERFALRMKDKNSKLRQEFTDSGKSFAGGDPRGRKTLSSLAFVTLSPMAQIAYLECSKCGDHINPSQPQTICPKDGGSLYVRFNLAALKGKFTPDSLRGRPATMWRYHEVLPGEAPVTLGEGFTPMLPSRENPNVYIKDEGLNPTGSFKARGLCAAVTMARQYGLKKLAVPSAGNAASALAAYCAAAGIEAHIFMPKDVPLANLVECKSYGAHVTLVDGLISDCARMVNERKQAEGWFDISTLKEPFRVEGKKTMGYEVAEQLNWELPAAIFYPTGGGVGLIGMWKAFDEMEQLGWLRKSAKRPKMIVVQASGCAPVVKAWNEHKPVAEMWQGAQTSAAGLRVPKPYADYIILDILKQSGGTAVSVSDEEIFGGVQEWASKEGLFASPEGAACLPAYQRLLREGFLKPTDKVVLFNTGSGLKYIDVIAQALKIGV